jgi:hypothetical protein
MDKKISTAERIGDWVSTLLLGKTKELIVRTDERLSGLVATVSEMKAELKTDIKALRDDLKEINNVVMKHGEDIAGLKVHTKFGVSNSPTVPNEAGKKLLEISGFYSAYPKLKKKIFILINAKAPRTLYDYEKDAQAVLMELKDDPLIDGLKNHAVNHPDEPLELIFEVASWIIRDDYAKEH